MLVRFLVKNLFSFDKLTEFNLLPGRPTRMKHHIYEAGNYEVLKLSAMYGANGAGKSNLIKAIALLRQFVVTGKMPIELITSTFKLNKNSAEEDVYLGIEFIVDDQTYYYDITINQGIVIEEDLTLQHFNGDLEEIIFSRVEKREEKSLDITFHENVKNDDEAAHFPQFLANELLQRNEPILFYLKDRKSEVFKEAKRAFWWFDKTLIPMFPESAPVGLTLHLQTNLNFLNYAIESVKAFDSGISDIKVRDLSIDKFFGEDDKEEAEKVKNTLRANPTKVLPMRIKNEEILFVNQNGSFVAKRLAFYHKGDPERTEFSMNDESDGTIRLLEFLPLFYASVHQLKVYLVDEIERSLHPLIIKELIKKFSENESTKGQLIFTTHESHLLDQDIFRQDEIWFAEKNNNGSTEIYPLSDFKEHHTIDIRKGYLNGRYGGIPFLGNLKDLNWANYAEAETV
jgi:uncharacterized protein